MSETNDQSEDSKDEKSIFRMEKVGNKDIVTEDLRKTTSPQRLNAMKHGMYANIPLYCNNCDLRPADKGGLGGCNVYKTDSICNVREDIKKYVNEFDTRKPEDMKELVDQQIKLLLERVAFAEFRAKTGEGGLLDKATLSQLHTLRDYIKLQNELTGTVRLSATETNTYDFKNDIRSIFRKATVDVPASESDGST